MEPSITILIPTYNRAKTIIAVWPSYFNDTNVKELIIVNDGSTDNTSHLIQSLIQKSPKPVRLIEHTQKMGQQSARHTAIAAATTEWVLFGEDDVWISPRYPSILLDEAKKLNAHIIAGRIVNIKMGEVFDESLLNDSNDEYEEPIFDMNTFSARFDAKIDKAVQAPFLHSIALIHRDVFNNVKYDSIYRGNGFREETDFYLSAVKYGYNLYLTPKATCFHIRGPLSKSGGQRGKKLNWGKIEFWSFINTWILLNKHWQFLVSKYNYSGYKSIWFFKYYIIQRIYLYISSILRGKISKTWG